MTASDLRARVASLCEAFAFEGTQTPFSFDLQPSTVMDKAYRIETEQGSVVGWFDYVEERTDLVRIWVARKFLGNPQAMYDTLLNDVSSLRAAVIRDGATSGEFFVPDAPGGAAIQAEAGKEYAVLRLEVPLNYEVRV